MCVAPDDEDDRPQRPRRYPSPALGTRIPTERERASELERRTRRDEESTPVNMPIPQLTQKISDRTKAITATTDSINRRVGDLEKGQAELQIDVVRLDERVIGLDGKVDELVIEARETRREREEREENRDKRRAEAADKELAFRRERTFKIIAIIIPTLTALGALVAGIVAATRDPAVRVISPSTEIHDTVKP